MIAITCPNMIKACPVMVPSEQYRLALGFPSIQTCTRPLAPSQDVQTDCQVFSLYSCPKKLMPLFLMFISIWSEALFLKIRKALAKAGVARENRPWFLLRSVKDLKRSTTMTSNMMDIIRT